MKTSQRIPNQRGFVLPALIMVSVVILALAAAVLTLGTGSLRVATHDQQSEQALYAAESGLAKAAEEIGRTGELALPFTAVQAETGAGYNVEMYRNDTDDDMTVPGGLVIPAGTLYLRSEGKSPNGTTRQAGALFSTSMGAFQVGALANTLTATNSNFDAYNSDNEAPGYSGPGYDPAAKELDRSLMASNSDSGTIFTLTDSLVDGALFVGPGGLPTTLVVESGSTSVGSAGTLSNAIELEDIEVPNLPSQDSGSSDPFGLDPGDPAPTAVTMGNLRATPTASGGVNFSNSCLSISMQPNGDFVAMENPGGGFAGGNLRCEGNIHDIRAGGAPTLNTGANKEGGTGFVLDINDGNFGFAGSWHFMQLDSTGQVTADGGPSALVGSQSTGSLAGTTTTAPQWLVNFLTTEPGGTTENPLDLTPGAYDTLVIDSVTTSLADEGTYVIKKLRIEGTGQLDLPASRRNVKIYVTEELSVNGVDAIANSSRKAPNLQILYTGTDPVNLAGGSKAFFTLMAPDADVNLTGPATTPTQFYGALVGQDVNVENADFHYDVATLGVGADSDNTTLTLMSRHR